MPNLKPQFILDFRKIICSPRVLGAVFHFAYRLLRNVIVVEKKRWTHFRFQKSQRLVPIFLLALMASGCGGSTETAAPDVSSDRANSDLAGSVTSKPGATVTDAQANSFARELQQALASGNANAIARLVDWEAILERAVEPFEIKASDKRDLVQANLADAVLVTSQISQSTRIGGAYQLVRIKEQEGDSFALFRFISPDGTFNYHMLRIRNIEGETKADQMIVASTGVAAAETFRGLLAERAKNLAPAGLITEAYRVLLEDLITLERLNNASKFGYQKEAIKIYDQLPDRLRTGRLAMLYRIKATPPELADSYLDSINEHLAKFPGDPAAGLVALDAGAVCKNVDMLRLGHRALTQWTGGDPYLDLLVGASLSGFGRTDLAAELTGSIDPTDIGLAVAHNYKLFIAADLGNHDEVLKQLRTLKGRYGVKVKGIDKSPKFKSFVDSAQYEQWKNEEGPNPEEPKQAPSAG